MDIKKMCDGGMPSPEQLKEKIAGSKTVEVIAAAYGTQDRGADVTAVVQDMVRKGSTVITISNEILGGDPVPSIQKHFGIVYRMNGTLHARAGAENETVKIGL